MIHTGRTSLKKVGKCWEPDSILRVICNIIVECRELLERLELCTTLHCVPGMAVCFRSHETPQCTLHMYFSVTRQCLEVLFFDHIWIRLLLSHFHHVTASAPARTKYYHTQVHTFNLFYIRCMLYVELLRVSILLMAATCIHMDIVKVCSPLDTVHSRVGSYQLVKVTFEDFSAFDPH